MRKAQLLHQQSAAKHLQMAAWEKYWFSITWICLIQHSIHNHSFLISIGPQEACLFHIARNKPVKQFIWAAFSLNKQEGERRKDAHTAVGNLQSHSSKNHSPECKAKRKGWISCVMHHNLEILEGISSAAGSSQYSSLAWCSSPMLRMTKNIRDNITFIFFRWFHSSSRDIM